MSEQAQSSGKTLLGGQALLNAVPYAPTPETDPFYAQPDPVPDVPPGTILHYRSVNFVPVPGTTLPNPAWQLQFMTEDVNGQPLAAVATVVQPLTPASTPTLLSFQFAEDGLGNHCAPSHAFTGDTSDPLSLVEGPMSSKGLALGWTLVYPDAEGPYSAYGAGRLEGQVTLDAIRAALQFQPLGLPPSTQVGLWGYSGGAIATAWAASLQKAYAPELNIVAVASGGTPADLLGVVKNVDQSLITNAVFFPLVMSAVEGVNRAYPDLVGPILNSKGQAAFESMKDGCLGGTGSFTFSPAGHWVNYTTPAEPFSSAGVVAAQPLISLPLAGNSPAANTFIYHAIHDELIPIAGVDAMVSAWCGDGSTVAYYRAATGEHVLLELEGAPLAIAYLTSRFGGAATVTPQGTTICN